jgi:hypothetical protein
LKTDGLGDAAAAALLKRINSVDANQLLFLESDALLALAHSRLFCPAVTEYRGAYFRTDVFDAAVIDLWFDKPGIASTDVERICNSLELGYAFAQETAVEVQQELASAIESAWRVWLPQVCQRATSVEVTRSDTGSPVLSFYASPT